MLCLKETEGVLKIQGEKKEKIAQTAQEGEERMKGTAKEERGKETGIVVTAQSEASGRD